MIRVRDAAEADVPGIAEVHVRAWRESYAAFLPAEALAGLSVEERARMWQGAFRSPDPRCKLLVAEQEGRIVGFCRGGPARSGGTVPLGTDAEVYAIYLLDAVKRQGVGGRLLRGVLDHLAAQGFASAGLWVLTDNTSARHFYESLGGIAGAQQSIEIRGEALTETAYRFELKG